MQGRSLAKIFMKSASNVKEVRSTYLLQNIYKLQRNSCWKWDALHSHSAYSLNIKCQKCAGIGLNGFIIKKINKN